MSKTKKEIEKIAAKAFKTLIFKGN